MNISPALTPHYSPTKHGLNTAHKNNNSEFSRYQPAQTQSVRSFSVQPNINGVMMPGASHSSQNWNSSPFIPNEIAPVHCLFKCSECQISKSSCEDLEVHIKVEHLNWLPFRCTICGATRASDNQIREHTYSCHKRTDLNEYAYIDDPKAKSQLQVMTDRALSSAIQQMVARRPPPIMANLGSRPTNGLPPHSNGANAANQAKRHRLHQILGRNISHDAYNDGDGPSSEGALNGLKTLTNSDHENDDNNVLSKLFSQQNNEDEIDPEEAGVSSSLLKTLKAASGEVDDSSENDDVFKTISSLFSANFDSLNSLIGSNTVTTPYNQHSGSSNSSTNGQIRRRTPGSAANQCASKKRVLGQCSKCNKPVTAGARQMHLFFHLSKDHNTFRFRCKFPGCSTEHYRKDQMENHQSKQHGQINHELMEDRSVELYDQIQKLSMELLGTLGNKPGPTADVAQIEYNKMLREQEESRRRKRGGNLNDDHDDVPLSMVGNNPIDAFQQIYKQNTSGFESPGDSERHTVKIGERIEELLECKLCHKMIINRTRGLHILHHARNDLGLIRYQCTNCDFKHERSQSVVTHGRKSHDTEDCVLDTLNQYEDEIKSLWKACFGHEQLFTSESKKKPKQLKTSESIEEPDLKDLKVEDSYQSFQSDAPSGLRLFTPTKNNNVSPSKQSFSSSGGTPSNKTSTSKKKSSRRFGIRKPQSKKRRAEMAKLREVSMRIGGAMYFKKRSSDAVFCEECNTYVSNRLTHHAYMHMECELYLCPLCKMGNSNRNLIIKHLNDFHDSNINPIDNRYKFVTEIKNKIRDCFPSVFVDAPVPSDKEIEQLKKNLDLEESQTDDGVNDHDDETENNAENESDPDDKDENSTHEESDTETDKGFNKFDEEMAEA